jgi:hypothetical protein
MEMRKFLIAGGLACALAAVPVGSAVGAATPTSHQIKGKGAGTLTLNGNSTWAIDGTVKVLNVGPLHFHSTGTTTAAQKITVATTFTAANGDTISTTANGTAKHTRLGRVYITKDTVTGGTGRFAGATGTGHTAAKAKLATPTSTTGTVKFVFIGKITY